MGIIGAFIGIEEKNNNNNNYIPQVTPFRSASDYLFLQPFSHTNAFLNSFVPSSCAHGILCHYLYAQLTQFPHSRHH